MSTLLCQVMNDFTIPPGALTRFRAAAFEFTRPAKTRCPRLQAVRDDIAALRAKGASFHTITELLGRCGIPASATCVMRFCQRVLGEEPARARKRKPRPGSRANETAVPLSPQPAMNSTTPVIASSASEAAQVALLDDLLSYQAPPDDKSAAQSGLCIAKIKFANPESHPQRMANELSPHCGENRPGRISKLLSYVKDTLNRDF